MTLQAVIDYLNDIKPNAFSENTLTVWINECEGHIQTEILCIDVDDIITYEYEADKDKELLVKPPHDKLYGMYLIAMTDFAYGEYSNYSNTLQMYNAALDEFAKWYIRHHTSEGTNLHGYYISAYGIAVKHGFEGTEEEWLMTLKGEQGPQGIQGPQGEKGDPGAVSSVIAGDNNGEIKVDGVTVGVFDNSQNETKFENLHNAIMSVDTSIGNINSSILNEAQQREQADRALQDNIDSEADIREQADSELQELINAEAGTRVAKDSELQTAISSEANAREQLQNRVDALENASVEIDDTLTVSGAAADSKVTGEALDKKVDKIDKYGLSRIIGVGEVGSFQPDKRWTAIEMTDGSLAKIPAYASDLENDSGFITEEDLTNKEDKSNKVTELSNTSTDAQYPSAKAVYDTLELKADKQSTFGGFFGGSNSDTYMGGAIGNSASSTEGGAVGHNASSVDGGAVGSGASTITGGAIGDGASSGEGFSGGRLATVATNPEDGDLINAIQLGQGLNSNPFTLQVYNHTVMEADGSLPYVHTARPHIKTENAETLELNSIYDLGVQTNLTLTLPSANYGNFIQVDFLSGDTATSLTISATSSALISDFDFVPESNKIYTLFFDYGRLDATNYGWRFSYAEYSYTPESEG